MSLAAAFTGAERARPPVGAGGRPARDWRRPRSPSSAAWPATYVLLASFIGLVAALSIWLSPPVSASVGGSFDAFNYDAAADFAQGPGGSPTAPRAARASLNLANDVSAQVDDATARASRGELRFPGHDGKPYLNTDETLPPRADYTEWTAAASGSKRGANRVIIAGDPASPDAIYYWDHVNPPVQIGP